MPTATRLQLAAELEALRKRAGLSTTAAANIIRVERATYCRYETGDIVPPYPSLRLLLDTMRTIGDGEVVLDDDEYTIMLELREQADQPVWTSEYRLTESMSRLVGFESIAARINVFELALVYGPLQTREYADAMIRATNPPTASEEKHRRDLDLRLERQQRTFGGEHPPELRLVLDESVIRRTIGGPAVMREQLSRLADVTGSSELRILPFDAPAHPGMNGPFWLFEFRVDIPRKPAVYVEAQCRNLYLDRPAAVDRCSLAFERLWETSLSPAESRSRILARMKELE